MDVCNYNIELQFLLGSEGCGRKEMIKNKDIYYSKIRVVK